MKIFLDNNLKVITSLLKMFDEHLDNIKMNNCEILEADI